MPMPISTKARKDLIRLLHYRSIDGVADTSISSLVDLTHDEQLLGVYENSPGYPTDLIIVTDKGIHVITNISKRFISYESIEEISSHNDKRELRADRDLRKLKLQLTDGSSIEVVISGTNEEGNCIDVLSFHTFLIHVKQLKQLERNSQG